MEELHSLCVRALQRYIEEVRQTCQLLTRVEKFPISPETRGGILQQRQFEDAAYDCYQLARQRLFAEAQWEERSEGP